MMKLGYYPGCSLLGTARDYDESLKAISRKIGLELVEIPDWNCCGATAAHNMNHSLSLALPARILALAENAGLEEILVPCAACYNRLVSAQHELETNTEIRPKISAIIEMEYKGTAKVLNILEVLTKHVAHEIDGLITKPFAYKAACYYGCLLVRPPKITKFDRAEDPQIMDTVMEKIGADTIDWEFKTECCGAGLSLARSDIVAKLSGKIVNDAANRGAEAIIVACPMCHSNLDMRRDKIEQHQGKKYSIPVLYITQALGLAFGIEEKKLGLQRHIVPVKLPVRNQSLNGKVPAGNTEESECRA